MTSTASKTFNNTFAKKLAALTAEPTFREDGKGRKVRVFSKDAPLTREIVRDFYTGVRGFHEVDALETIGYDGLRAQLAAGHLVRDSRVPTLYWITKKAGANYGLRKPLVQGREMDWQD